MGRLKLLNFTLCLRIKAMSAAPDYLEKILNAQVYDLAEETPLDLADNLSARVHNRIWLKREVMAADSKGFLKQVDIPFNGRTFRYTYRATLQ